MTTQPIHISLDASATLSKAVIRTAERLHLSKTELAKVLGLSPPTITRLHSGHYVLEEKRKEWEFALLLNRVFRSLDSILANEQAIRQWLNSNNLALGGKPIELIQQTEGLVRVIQYLDSSRSIV